MPLKFRTKNSYGRKKKKKFTQGHKPKTSELPRSTVMETESAETSFSCRKSLLEEQKKKSDAGSSASYSDGDLYLLIRQSVVSKLVAKIKCQGCDAECSWQTKNAKGFAGTFEGFCARCGEVEFEEHTSSQVELVEPDTGKKHFHFEINTRAVLAASRNNLHHWGLVNFMGLLGINGSLTTRPFQSITRLLHGTSKKVVEESLKQAQKAVKAFYQKQNVLSDQDQPVIDIDVTFDGSWHKRGHTSVYGVAFCIDSQTNIIVDYHILSKFCRMCAGVGSKLEGQEKEEIHRPQCHKNYDGSSGGMEVAAAEILWKRSIDIGFRYTTRISDGDSAVFKKLKDLKPYGDCQVQKEECINHVAKRMFSALDKAVKDQRAKNFQMNGKGKLTVLRMKKWGQYYRNAIVSAAPDTDAIINRIWAILKHSTSTPDSPQHEHCDGSWCYYKQKKAEGLLDPIPVPKNHDTPLSKEIGEKLEPIFERLADKDLISRCRKLCTPNANESLHSTVWAKCPKTKFVGKPQIEAAIQTAVHQWNNGLSSITAFTEPLDISIGPKYQKMTKEKDSKRDKDAMRSIATKQNRKRKKLEKVREEQSKQQREGPLYSSGMF